MKKNLLFLFISILTINNVDLFNIETKAATTYTNDYLYTVNTDTSTTTSDKSIFSNINLNNNLGYYDTPIANEIDTKNNKVLKKTERHFNFNPKEINKDVVNFKNKLKSFDTTSYSIGDTKTFNTNFDATYTTVTKTKQIECRYIAKHCTIWISKSDDLKIQLSDEQCKTIGDNFDSNWAKELELFGNYIEIAKEDNNGYFQYGDADYDGKLAIVCYDIDNDYLSDTPIEDYAGGFYNRLDNIIDKDNVDMLPEYKNSSNLMDCIHIDTYPSMGEDKNNPLTDIDSALGILYHEGQHLIQRSYGKCLPDYLDEGFSMAAEHAIMGGPSINERLYAERIQYFNDSALSGYSLTYFTGSFEDYANDYVFTQYLRTQFKATELAESLNDSTGETFYKQVLRNYKNATKDKDSDSVVDSDYENVILDLLGNLNYVELVKDFWKACMLKAPSGTHGFNSDDIAEYISPYINDSLKKINVYNGGCVFYKINNSFTIDNVPENLYIGTLDSAKISDFNVSDTEQIYDGTNKKVTVTPKTDDVGVVDAILYYTIKDNNLDQVYLYTEDGKFNDSPSGIGKYNVKIYTHGSSKYVDYPAVEAASVDIVDVYDDYIQNSGGGIWSEMYKERLYNEIKKSGLDIGTFKILNESGVLSINIYRLYNNNTGEHLFTSSDKEYNKLGNIGWTQEGKTFEAYDNEDKPSEAVAVYRMFNKNGFNGKGDHHYTKSQGEIEKLQKLGWTLDFDGKPAFYAVGSIDVIKLYNSKTGAHHYTPKQGEVKNMSSNGWINEGVGWTVVGYYNNSGTLITQ